MLGRLNNLKEEKAVINQQIDKMEIIFEKEVKAMFLSYNVIFIKDYMPSLEIDLYFDTTCMHKSLHYKDGKVRIEMHNERFNSKGEFKLACGEIDYVYDILNSDKFKEYVSTYREAKAELYKAKRNDYYTHKDSIIDYLISEFKNGNGIFYLNDNSHVKIANKYVWVSNFGIEKAFSKNNNEELRQAAMFVIENF